MSMHALALHVLLLVQDAAATTPSPTPTVTVTAKTPAFDWLGPIAGSGLVGVFLLMTLLRIKIMPSYVYDEAKKDWEREREGLLKDINELKTTLREANSVYTTQVIPTLTRVLDAERELVELRREEQSERRRRAL